MLTIRKAGSGSDCRRIHWMVMVVWSLIAPALKADTGGFRSGVVFEELDSDSPLVKAGIESGDILVAWRRLSSPPANPEEAHGEIHSVFDWYWMTMEQAPRGPVELTGLRGSEMKTFALARGPWGSGEWPWMPRESLDAFLQKRADYFSAGDGKDRVKEIEIWWEKTTAQQRDWQLRSWLWARLGKMRAARGAWEEAYEAYYSAIAEASEPFAESLLWWELGQLRQRHSELDLARQAYLTAKSLREIAGHTESLVVAHVLNDLGALAWERGELNQADELLQQVLQIRQCLTPDSLLVAQTLNDLGLVASDRRQLDRAAYYFQRSFQLFQELLPNSLALANSLNNLGLLAGNRRDWDQASLFFQRAMEIKEKLAPESLDFAQGLHNLATVAAARGDLSQATASYRRCLEIRQKLAPGSLRTAGTLTSLGNIYILRGDLDLAVDFQQRALEIRQRLAPESLQIAESLFNIALIEERRGKKERAKELYDQAMIIRQRLAPASLEVAGCLNSLAVLAAKRGDLKQALQLHQQALDLRQKLAPDSIEVANTLNNLGDVMMQAGQLDQAEEVHRRALEIQSNRVPEGRESARSLSYLGDIAYQAEDWARAISFYQRALRIQEDIAPGTATTARALHDLGSAHRMMSPQALGIVDDLFRRALDTLDLQLSRFGGTQDMRAQIRTQYSDFYRDAIEVQLKIGQHPGAFHTLERFRARGLLDQLAERDTIFTTDISENLDRERRRIAFRIDHTQRDLSKLSHRDNTRQIEELREQLRRLRDEASDIEARIRRASPKLAALQYPQPLDLESTRFSLDPGTLLLSYSVGNKEILLFSLSKDQDLRVDSVAINGQELRDKISYLLREIGSKVKPGSQRNHNFETLARKLESLLIEPVSDRIATSKRLLILPDGPLHLLPWGSLIRELPFSTENRGRNWQYLTEWKPISTTLSATLFAEQKKYRRSAHHETTPPELAMFGDPLFPRMLTSASSNSSQDIRVRSAVDHGFSFEPLPTSRIEVEEIVKLFLDGAKAYLGPNATEENAKSLPRDTRIVHFATHATLDERSPLDSAVVLSIPEKFEEGKENGLLQAWEIFERVRIDADLVVLSACESGLGKEMGGEGLIGLTRAFQYAGARSVMASLWKISDRTTAELMVRFYKHLKAGKPKDEALRAAQMELIRGPIQIKNEKGEMEEFDASAPYYWAAFQIYGDWQ